MLLRLNDSTFVLQIEEIIIGTSETSVLKNIKVNRRDSVSDLSV